MGKISDLAGGWLEDEDGHGIYDEAGMTESIAGVLSLAGTLAAKLLASSRTNTGALSYVGAASRSAILHRSLVGDI